MKLFLCVCLHMSAEINQSLLQQTFSFLAHRVPKYKYQISVIYCAALTKVSRVIWNAIVLQQATFKIIVLYHPENLIREPKALVADS